MRGGGARGVYDRQWSMDDGRCTQTRAECKGRIGGGRTMPEGSDDGVIRVWEYVDKRGGCATTREM